jgi:hypothetical protein
MMAEEEWLEYWLRQAPVLSGVTLERVTERMAEDDVD